jgi:hypothetical protein
MRFIYGLVVGIVSFASDLAPDLSAGELYTIKSTDRNPWYGADINSAGDVAGSFNIGLYYNGEYLTVVPALGGSGHYLNSTINSINDHRIMVGESTTGIVNK